MSLFEIMGGDIPTSEIVEEKKPPKKGKKSKEVQEVIEGNPYLIDIDDGMDKRNRDSSLFSRIRGC